MGEEGGEGGGGRGRRGREEGPKREKRTLVSNVFLMKVFNIKFQHCHGSEPSRECAFQRKYSTPTLHTVLSSTTHSTGLSANYACIVTNYGTTYSRV